MGKDNKHNYINLMHVENGLQRLVVYVQQVFHFCSLAK